MDVSTHSHPKVAGKPIIGWAFNALVSTHSHPKVAGPAISDPAHLAGRFNTQPPEGGWRRLPPFRSLFPAVSTHSHPKVAGGFKINAGIHLLFQHTATRRWLVRRWTDSSPFLCFNTQPPEGGWASNTGGRKEGVVSTHSHPKVAGRAEGRWIGCNRVSTHSHPKVAGRPPDRHLAGQTGFNTQPPEGGWGAAACLLSQVLVSTHSHPKVAGRPRQSGCRLGGCFNTQPPEGGWAGTRLKEYQAKVFQHTATRRWLVVDGLRQQQEAAVSTHSHPKVAGAPK